mgnify:CR=1 FL=1|jgi:hypothetical protein
MTVPELIGKLTYYGITYAIGDNLGREIQGTDELLLSAADAIAKLYEACEDVKKALEDRK